MTITEIYVPIVVAFVSFLSISLLFGAIFIVVRIRAQRRTTIEKIQQSGKTGAADAIFPTLETSKALPSPVLSFLGALGKRIGGKKVRDYSKLRPMFLKAGIRYHNAPAVFWGIKIIFAALLPVCLLILRLLYPQFVMSHKVFILVLALSALAGFYLPNAGLRLKTDRRKEKIRDGFPDALDLLVVCVEAGMGLDGAVNRVSKELALDNKTLSEELNIMNLELRGGKSRRDALKNLAMRTDLEDVSSLSTLLIQTDKLGTSVAQALRVYSDTFRTKRYMKAEEEAAKIPVKLTIPLILFIFPALLVTIMGPAWIRIARILLPTLG